MTRKHKALVAQTQSEIRTETLMGKAHMVVPVVAMVEGVRFGANAGGAGELGLATEFGKFPVSWNNQPVVLDHPQIGNTFVSAGESPQVLEDNYLGLVQNTKLSGSRLLMEAWLDEALREDDKFKNLFERLDANEMLEVSVGFFTETEELEGTHNGVDYTAVWRNIVPDHLALLSEGLTGACSIADGCGTPRINKAYMLTTQEQSKLNHEANVSKKDTTEVKTETTVNKTGGCGCGCNGAGTCKLPDPVVLTHTNTFKVNEANEVLVPESELKAVQALITQMIPNGVLDSDIRQAVHAQLRKEHGFAWLIGFTTDVCIFEKWDDAQDRYMTFQMPFDMNDMGSVTFTGDPTEVTLMTRIIDAANSNPNINEETNMSKDKTETTPKVNEAVEPAKTGDPVATVETVTEVSKEVTPQASVETKETPKEVKPMSVQEYIQNAPDEFRDTLATMHASHEARKTAVITALKATERCTLPEEYLKAQSLQTLEQLQTLAAVPAETPDYSGRATPITPQVNDNACVTAPKVFEAKTDA